MQESRKSRAAIHRVDFRPRVLEVANQLKRLVPCDGCRIEEAISRRAASAYERARFPGVRSRRLMFDRADRPGYRFFPLLRFFSFLSHSVVRVSLTVHLVAVVTFASYATLPPTIVITGLMSLI